MKIFLASKSPRRRELLENLGFPFQIVENDIEEVSSEKEPSKYVMDLAFKKALKAAENIKEEGIVIAADTIVVVDGEILGKPKDREEAFSMLKTLQGREHIVYTGIAVIKLPEMKHSVDYQETKVWIRRLEDEDISNYIDTGECWDKAGAYAIQGFGSLIVEKIEGDYFNVVGLPVAKLFGLLKREFGVKWVGRGFEYKDKRLAL